MREVVFDIVIAKSMEKEEKLRTILKNLETNLFNDLKDGKYGEFSILHALFYSYLEPVKSMTINNFKQYLQMLKDKHELLSFETFYKEDAPAST